MTLYAGVGRRDITPAKPMFLCGFPHVERISTGVHDPLLACALYLRRGEDAVLLVAVDNLFVNPPVALGWRRAIAAATGVPEACILISTSHTHSGPHTAYVLEWGPSPVVPEVDPGYLEDLHRGVVAAAVSASESVVPAELAWTTAQVDGVGCNRHDPEHGARDPEASILAVRDIAGDRLLALSVTYSMHPTVMHEDSTLVSADFPGMMRQYVQEQLADEPLILYHTGPAGNQSPRYHVNGQTFAEAIRLGQRLGDFIIGALADLEVFDAEPALAGIDQTVSLPWRALPTVAEARERLAEFRGTYQRLQDEGAPHGPVRTAECDVFGAEETLYLAECVENGHFQEVMADYDPVHVQVVRIGDRCLVGFPGELFVEFGLAVKARAALPTVPINLVNGELQGYIVTEEAIREGRYESNNRAFGVDAGETLVRASLTAVENLR